MATLPIPKPPVAQIVTEQVLKQAQWAAWRSAAAFTGATDPSWIWTMLVREDSYAIPLYRELEDKDDDVSAATDELKLSVLEREWALTPGDDSGPAVDACADMTAMFENLDLDGIFDSQLDAAPYGYSVSEMMFDNSAGQARLVAVDDCPQELFLFGDRFQPQVGNLQLLPSIGAGSGSEVPEEKFMVFSYRGRSRSRMGRPLLKQAFWPSWFKRQILGLWLKAGGKANGTALARYAEGATQAEIDLALQTAEALVEGVAFAAPEDLSIDIDLLKVAADRNPAIYEKLFTQMQYSIARSIKGETLTSFGNEGGHGSRGQGQTHQETFDKRSISLAKKHARVVNRQMIQRLSVWNYGPKVAQPKFAWDTEEEEDLVQKGTVISLAQRIGVPIGQKWAAAQLQIPPIAADDLPLVPNVNAPALQPPSSAFSERTAGEAEANADLSALDELAAQLRDSSVKLYKTRVREVADNLRTTVEK